MIGEGKVDEEGMRGKEEGDSRVRFPFPAD